MNSIKNKILGTLKTKDYVEKGEATCRNAKAVQDIFDNKKLTFAKKLDLINRYIPGIKDKMKNDDIFEFMQHKNDWLEFEVKLCKEYMASIGVDNPLKIKKFVSRMLKLNDIEIVVTPAAKTFYDDKPKPRRRRSSSSSIQPKANLMVKSNSASSIAPNPRRSSTTKPRNSNVERPSLAVKSDSVSSIVQRKSSLVKSDSVSSVARKSNAGRASLIARSNSVNSPIRYSVMMADTLSESSPIKK
jgi:hypothetical protein